MSIMGLRGHLPESQQTHHTDLHPQVRGKAAGHAADNRPLRSSHLPSKVYPPTPKSSFIIDTVSGMLGCQSILDTL